MMLVGSRRKKGFHNIRFGKDLKLKNDLKIGKDLKLKATVKAEAFFLLSSCLSLECYCALPASNRR